MTEGGLNPCSNGICAKTLIIMILLVVKPGLNPCSNGICAKTERVQRERNLFLVLILVLMEYAPRHKPTNVVVTLIGVLILVLMEYAPRQNFKSILGYFYFCLNPCSNGICAKTTSPATVSKIIRSS